MCQSSAKSWRTDGVATLAVLFCRSSCLAQSEGPDKNYFGSHKHTPLLDIPRAPSMFTFGLQAPVCLGELWLTSIYTVPMVQLHESALQRPPSTTWLSTSKVSYTFTLHPFACSVTSLSMAVSASRKSSLAVSWAYIPGSEHRNDCLSQLSFVRQLLVASQ